LKGLIQNTVRKRLGSGASGEGRVFRQAREEKVPKIAIRLLAVILALLAGLSAGAAGAAEIKVVSRRDARGAARA
jgi:hypothetical protein